MTANRLPSLSGLRAFDLAGRLLSFQGAAHALNVTPTAISHRIRRLEAELGQTLFRRGTREVSLSDAGKALLPDVEAAFRQLQRGLESLKRADGHGVLTVSTVASFAVKWLVPRLGSFQALYPDIDVRIATGMGMADFVSDGVDVALRYGGGTWPGLRADKLMAEDWHPVCAPALLSGSAPLATPADLAAHTLLHVSAYPDDWQRWLTMVGHSEVQPARNLTFDESATSLQAAINGLGVALGRRAFVEEDLAAGRLVDPFGIHLPQETAFYVVAPQERADEPAIAAFRSWILDQADDTPAL